MEKELERLIELTGKGQKHYAEREKLVEALKAKGWDSLKVNIPDCGKHYINGNGEGIFALFSPKDYHDCTTDKDGGIIQVVTLNMSAYYEDIGYGYVIDVELRGVNRAVMRWFDNNPAMPWKKFDTSVNISREIAGLPRWMYPEREFEESEFHIFSNGEKVAKKCC